jgi:DNA-binding NtrC family response regulator
MKTLLLLEDEPHVLKLLSYMLRQYKLLQAATAEQALGLYVAHDTEVDVLIADVTLPKSSGIQVALSIRVESPDLPVVLTSGYPVADWSPRDTADLETLGSKSLAILSKPFLAQDLLRAVRRFTGESQPAVARTA